MPEISAHLEQGAVTAEPLLRMEGVTKRYQGLRPLRVASLVIMPGERVSIAGLDGPAAELLVNLVTGAALPDEGSVWTFGRRTSDIADAEDWLTWLDHFGIVSERGVLLEASTLEQNLAMPFTLEIDPVPPPIAGQVAALARECGIAEALLPHPASALPPDVRLRVHLARAVALSPRLLLVEHPTGAIPSEARAALAADAARVCEARQLPALIMTNDDAFARAAAPKNLKLEGATGTLRPLRKSWFYLVKTPHATLGPPLTPDFGGPVIP
jgi:ABC-type lipoprotein export system ATPase subunit